MNNVYLKNRLLTASAALVAVGTLATGCINNAPSAVPSTVSLLAVQSGGNDPLTNPLPVVTPTPTPTPSVTPTPRSGSPVQGYTVTAIGYRAAKITVSARTILRVRFTPGQQDGFVAGTGFSPAYSKLGVYISARGYDASDTAVWGPAIATPMLSNGIFTAKGSSPIMDFSAQIPKACSATDTTCRETVEIKIDRPNNDYYCMNFGTYCNWTWVYDTHPWNGVLEVETDDTAAMQ